MRRASIPALIVVALAFTASPARACLIINVMGETSLNGRFRFRSIPPNDLVSPEKPWRYQLRDLRTGRVVWTRPVSEGDADGIAHVDDTGWVVIEAGLEKKRFVALEPTAGRISLTFDMTDESETCTTDGICGAGKGPSFFMRDSERTTFVIRSFPRKTVVLDLADLRAELPRDDQSERIDHREAEWALLVLRRAATLFTRTTDYRIPRDLLPALRVVEQRRLADAVGDLRRIERCKYIGSEHMEPRIGIVMTGGKLLGYAKGAINPYRSRVYYVRQWTLGPILALGESPAPLPRVQFAVEGRDGVYRDSLPRKSRIANASKVQPGMTAEQVLEVVGGPDTAYGNWIFKDEEGQVIIKWTLRQPSSVEEVVVRPAHVIEATDSAP